MSAVPDLILYVRRICSRYKASNVLDPWGVIFDVWACRIKSRIQNCYPYWLECPGPMSSSSRLNSIVKRVNMAMDRGQNIIHPFF
jgi:hypothetical protein